MKFLRFIKKIAASIVPAEGQSFNQLPLDKSDDGRIHKWRRALHTPYHLN